jgi:Amt family ammonium transporter
LHIPSLLLVRCAGFVTVGAAALIGIITAVICSLVQLLMDKYGRKYVDDTLDVFACHGVGGTVGQILTGLFATKAINSYGADGAFYGNPLLLGKIMLAVIILIPWMILATLLCLWVTNFVLELRAPGE